MPNSHIASRTIAELREFAGFKAQEQFFIERSLDLALQRSDCPPGFSAGTHRSSTLSQYVAYHDLRASRHATAEGRPIEALDRFLGLLVRVSAQDLARGLIESFAAYRFLYERLLGAAVRPYLPASFCAAAALPQIDPHRRRLLLATLPAEVIATSCWSAREPEFFPRTIADEVPEEEHWI